MTRSPPPPPPAPSTSGSLPVAILVPARDEAETLPALLEALGGVELRPPAFLQRVVVVDNGSRDGTGSVARRCGAEVVEEPRRGYGAACLAGLRALAEGSAGRPGAVVFLDADDVLAPSQLDALLEPLRRGSSDLVLGERRAAAGRGVRPHAALGNRLVCWVLRGAYGSDARDLGPFRAITWRCLRGLAMDDPGYGWTVQMQARALKAGYRVAAVPVRFRRRTAGRSKVSGSVAASVAAGWVILSTLATELLRTPPVRSPGGIVAGAGSEKGTQSRVERRN